MLTFFQKISLTCIFVDFCFPKISLSQHPFLLNWICVDFNKKRFVPNYAILEAEGGAKSWGSSLQGFTLRVSQLGKLR